MMNVQMSDWENNEDIKLFREYLRIPTVHPDVNYDECVEFLRRQAKAINLPIDVYYPATKPMIVLKWFGTDPSLPAILLYSHMDVVPVFMENWTHDPFAAVIEPDGKIYGRGTQDVKSLGIQHLAAVKALKLAGVRVKRNILIMFGSDEEMAGINGMKPFIQTKEFTNLNIGFALDESAARPDPEIHLVYNERKMWPVKIKCSGAGGHGMLLLKKTAGEKLRFMLDKFMNFRAVEVQKLKDNPDLTLGKVTTVNVTILKGGVQNNVVPPEFTIMLDIRIGIETKQSELEEMFNDWCKEAGKGVELIYDDSVPQTESTDPEDNILYQTVKTAIEEMGISVKPAIALGATDSRFLRSKGILAVGFTPMNNTPTLLHANDEYLTVDTFLKGIDIFKNVIHKVGNI